MRLPLAMTSHHTFGPCHKCGRGGHLARECSIHVCFRCNGYHSGDREGLWCIQKDPQDRFSSVRRGHMAWECVEGVTCSRCGERGHLQRNCKNVSCHKCGRKGHISKFCNDPFIKAEEFERNERQLAFLKSRTTSGQGSDNSGSSARAAAGSGTSQKRGPGPWDGLGDPGQDRALTEAPGSGLGVVFGKPGTNRSQGGMLANVKVLTVKRKIYPEANREVAKRRPHQNCVNLETNRGGISGETSPCKDTLKAEEPLQWNGLLGYASDDSRDDSHVSIDEASKDQNCNLEECVHTRLKSTADERNSTAVLNCVDETSSSEIGLQPRLEHEPTRADEGNGSETGLHYGLEQELAGVDERNGSEITEPSNVEEVSLTETVQFFMPSACERCIATSQCE